MGDLYGGRIYSIPKGSVVILHHIVIHIGNVQNTWVMHQNNRSRKYDLVNGLPWSARGPGSWPWSANSSPWSNPSWLWSKHTHIHTNRNKENKQDINHQSTSLKQGSKILSWFSDMVGFGRIMSKNQIWVALFTCVIKVK